MSKANVVSGIDIGTNKICTIIASQSSETGQYNVIGVSATPSSGFRKSQIVDLEEAITSITDSVEAAERMAGYTISRAFVSISGTHIESQNSKGVVAVSEPEGEITAADVERVIEAARAVSLANAREIIHVIPRDYVVDSQGGIRDPIGMTGVRLEAEAHLVTGSSTAIKNITKAISELGIEVEGLVFTGIASSAAVLSDTEKELGVVLVDIGAGTTSITAFVEGSITHSSVLPIGAKNITNDLAIGMRISLDSAEKVKLHLSKTHKEFQPKKGMKSSEISRMRKMHDMLNLEKLGIKEESSIISRKALIEGIIRPRLVELFGLVGQELQEAKLLGNTPAGIVLTGGGARTVTAIGICKKSLSLPCRVGIPSGLSGLVDELSAPEYSSAAGLIKYGIKHSTPGNLKPAKLSMPTIMSDFNYRKIYDKVINFLKSLIP